MVIICYNYGHYLAEAIDSVLYQSKPPAEVLVVDDGSTDGTEGVAAAYSDRGVRYLKLQNRGTWEARKAGFESTNAPCICFLDADDTLGQGYLEQAASTLKENWRVGIVYTDMFNFGDNFNVRRSEVMDIERVNYIHAGSVVRRTALITSRAFETPPTSRDYTQNDWVIWRKVLDYGWEAEKSDGVYNYRRHSSNQSSIYLNRVKSPWPTLVDVYNDRVAILLPLSGRYWAWPMMKEFLEYQTWPHNQIELIIGDTSQDGSFSSAVRDWLAGCDYEDVRHIQFTAGRPGLADENRRGNGVPDDVNLAVCSIWQRLSAAATSPWVLTLEDDISPLHDVLFDLFEHFDKRVDAVCSPYRSRIEDRYSLVGMDGAYIKEGGAGVQRIRSSGFGCLLVRTQLLKDHVWAPAGPRGRWYDPWFFESTGKHLLCDWDCPSEHLNAPGTSNVGV